MLHTGNPWGNRSFITVCQPGGGKKKMQTQCDAYMEFKVTAVLVSLGCSKCVFQGMTDTAGTVIAWIPETSLAFWVSGCLAKCLGHDNPSGGVSQAVNKARRDKWLHSTKQQLSLGRQTLEPYLKSQTHPLCGVTASSMFHPARACPSGLYRQFSHFYSHLMQMSLQKEKYQTISMCWRLHIRLKFALCWMKESMSLSGESPIFHPPKVEFVYNEASEMMKPLN